MLITVIISVAVVGVSAWSVKILRLSRILPSEASYLTNWHAIGFLVSASCFLMLIFFLRAYMQLLLTVFMAIGGTMSIVYLLSF